MLKLYDHNISGNCYKVRLLLNHLGVDYEKANVDVLQGEQHKPEFVAFNPNKKIPVLIDGDFVIWESNAILLYLGKKFSPNPLFPEDPERFGQVAQWLLFGKTTLDPNLARARFITRFAPEINRDEKELNSLREGSSSALKILEDHLKKSDFLAGSYSIADIGCYPYVSICGEGGVSLTPYPSVRKWCDRIVSQPGYIPMYDPQ